MQRENLPIWRTLQQLLLQVELSVKSFSRYHKYTIYSGVRVASVSVIKVIEHGYLRGGLKKRVLSQLRLPANTALIRQVAQ